MPNVQKQQDDTSMDSGMNTETNTKTNASTTNASINASTSNATMNHYNLPALNQHSMWPRLIIEPLESSTINNQKYLRFNQCTLTDISIEASLANREGYPDLQIIRMIVNGRSVQQNQVRFYKAKENSKKVSTVGYKRLLFCALYVRMNLPYTWYTFLRIIPIIQIFGTISPAFVTTVESQLELFSDYLDPSRTSI